MVAVDVAGVVLVGNFGQVLNGDGLGEHWWQWMCWLDAAVDVVAPFQWTWCQWM